jgi:hypothetical protein
VAAFVGSIVFPAILLVAYVSVYSGDRWDAMLTVDRSLLWAEVAFEAIGAFIVGRYLGRGLSYGFLGKQLAYDGVKLNMILGHSDNAAGLRPIGDFYFYQAIVTALPVIFFAFWVLVTPVWAGLWPSSQSEFAAQWTNTYLACFVLALGIEVLSFVLPLWFFHQEMTSHKREMQTRVDELSAKLSRLQRERTLQTDLHDDGDQRVLLNEQIALLENQPTWALAPDVRQRFAWGNIACLSPVALQMSRTLWGAVTGAAT